MLKSSLTMNEDKSEKILIAAAWPYANAPIHEGHPPGYLIPADIFARFNRLIGNDVLMVSGTDAHGTPNIIAAEKANIPTGEHVDNVHKANLEFWEKLSLSYDLYTKTSNASHKKKFIELFMEIYKNGFVVKKKVKYFYSEKEKKALLDRYIEGECPHCHFEKARGDQCDNCGKALTPFDIINPYSIYGDEKLEIKETEDLFFDLPKLQTQIEEWIKDKDYWKAHVMNFTKAWLDEGLLPRSITRDINWGIEIPDGVDLPDKANKRFYVWVEAVAGYLTASQTWSEIASKAAKPDSDDYMYDNSHQTTDWRDWWFNPSSKHYYFMGKDNIPFHTIIWPFMLMAANKNRKAEEKYNLPYDVPANQYMNLESQKISKSRNWFIGLDYLLSNYDVNLVRYYFTARMPENKDSDFKWKDFIDINNNELVATLGNFIHRTLVFTQNNFDLTVPQGTLNNEVRKEIDKAFNSTRESLSRLHFADALSNAMELARFGNKYFNDSKVWEVIKEDKQKAGEIIFNCIQIINALSILLNPFMPDFSDQIRAQFGLKEINPTPGENKFEFNTQIPSGTKVNKPTPIFAKIDDKQVEIEEAKLGRG